MEIPEVSPMIMEDKIHYAFTLDGLSSRISYRQLIQSYAVARNDVPSCHNRSRTSADKPKLNHTALFEPVSQLALDYVPQHVAQSTETFHLAASRPHLYSHDYSSTIASGSVSFRR